MAKAKEKPKSKKPSKVWEMYNSDGTKKRKECPKCQKGIFLAEHKNPQRYLCGKCGYLEFIKNSN